MIALGGLPKGEARCTESSAAMSKAVMPLVRVALPHALLDLARAAALGANGLAGEGAGKQLRAGADDARPGDHGVRADNGSGADADRTAARVQHREGIDARAGFHAHALWLEHGRPRIVVPEGNLLAGAHS